MDLFLCFILQLPNWDDASHYVDDHFNLAIDEGSIDHHSKGVSHILNLQ